MFDVTGLPTENVPRELKHFMKARMVCPHGHTMRAFIKRFKFGNASQTMFMNKFPIENQAQITISVVKLDFIIL